MCRFSYTPYGRTGWTALFCIEHMTHFAAMQNPGEASVLRMDLHDQGACCMTASHFPEVGDMVGQLDWLS
ncbi:hypothetical protein [Alcanivorax jadensis]|jgi:hypothetical protein|uniref:hypothetical protein n=1 Tax=Alcanivorax jadensis TaxID=64988 RepID=UPI00235706A1|nr:hypothetical protein [Alcanivorax jadensis]|tara:strand:- start:15369 stop:15578 length:210 start_codon:yes stop_codon:yes gene_type:complete